MHQGFSRIEEITAKRGYSVTSDGRVIKPDGKQAKTWPRNGYQVFSGTKHHKCKVHRLQAWQNFGDKIYQPGIVVRHLDGNPNNNSAENITIGTDTQNAMDRDPAARWVHAQTAVARAVKHSHSEIIQYRACHTFTETRARFGLCKSMMHFIMRKSLTAQFSKSA